MYKLYTSCLNLFIQDHCESNEIVIDEQAGGKKGVCLDYAKAFNSVSHSWLFTALRLANFPEDIVVSIEKMSKLWATIVTLKGTNQTVKTDIITYFKCLFQDDSL